MGLASDIVMAVPIGIIYNVLTHKIGEIFNNDMDYTDKVQRNLLLAYGSGIFALILALTIFTRGAYKNRAIKFGLFIGAGLLIMHSLCYNWGIMDNDTKFIIMIVALASLMIYTYNNKTDDGDSDYVDYVDYLPATYYSYPVKYKELYDDE